MSETRLKLVQYITGIGLFIVVGIHLIVTHLGGEEASSWESVSERASSAGWLALFIIMLLFGLYHGLLGLRTIILELPIRKPPPKVLDGALILIGLAIFIYAAYIPISAF